MSKILKMTFAPYTIEHLGVKMYSTLPSAIAELIANAYDAEATEVNIILNDTNDEKSISISDNGLGMSFDEINNKFLRIGRKRREDENDNYSVNKKRRVTGRKGLGKLALFGIGEVIEIETSKNGDGIKFVLEWSDIIKTENGDYKPKFEEFTFKDKKNGTVICLKKLKRKTAFNDRELAVSLSKMFNCFDNQFNVYVQRNNNKKIKIEYSLRYEKIDIQIRWILKNEESLLNNYIKDKKIFGEIFASEKPLKPEFRGITLFAHGRLVNLPEFFGVGESSHGYSYLTGWLNVDFIDELAEDMISTNRQSLNWDLEEMVELKENLKQLLLKIERLWRTERAKEKTKAISKRTDIDVNKWKSTLPEGEVKANVENILNLLTNDSELDNEKQSDVIIKLHQLIPEYPLYHWRFMHKIVKEISKESYKKKDYYKAAFETIKKYEKEVQRRTSSTKDGQSLMSEVFGKDKPVSVTSRYKLKDGSDFCSETKENIEEGQKFLSMGLMAGVRNPLAHEIFKELEESKLFTEDDCLNILSLISHLFRRVDDI